MGRTDICMTPDEIGAVLTDATNLQVATLGVDGFPHLTTLWFFVDHGIVTFRSFTKSQRIVNLMREPKLTVLAELGDDYSELRGVMIQGTAELSTDPEQVMRVYYEVARKMEGPDVSTEAIEAGFGRFATKNTVVRVIPHRIISWDHRKLSGY
ncbi:MAG: pyridoxamine 5'-phosphate oxidase family protein [Acidimicrobiia bacterium]|nr:pyridoxamine 5'-phosphate oxidase family protein [Acidimicrobiia bacterium]